MEVKIISKEKFKTEIFDFSSGEEAMFEHATPVILNFFATWCGPCHSFAPALEMLAEENPTAFKVFKIDIDADPEIPALFGIRSVPTTLFFTQNEMPAMVSGNIGEDGLRRAIAALFKIGTQPGP
ncbi:hypothetical protein BH10BDE1_BH10BDE1_27750 [soil metagenome]